MVSWKMYSYIFSLWFMAYFFKFGLSFPATVKNKTTANACVLSKRMIPLYHHPHKNQSGGMFDEIWHTRIIPYRFDSVFNEREKTMVKKVMANISRNSCVKFQELPADDDTTYHARIMSLDGCYTRGTGKYGPYFDPETQMWQNYLSVSLNKLECFDTGTITHELFHVLGFAHEMKRPDRDKYVNIMWDDIPTEDHRQFDRLPEDRSVTFDFSYDYNSIMHYQSYDGSTSYDKPTMFPTDPAMSHTSIGQGDNPTEMDYFKLNLLYECKNKHSPASSWSVWGACIKQYNGEYLAIRQRFCSRENVSECWKGGNRVKTENRTCDINYEARKNLTFGSWDKWSTWSICNITNERIFDNQRRTRKCDVGRRCKGSNTQTRSCRTDGKVRGELDCTFEVDYCYWCGEQTNEEYRWRAKIGKGGVMRDGPLFDHTTMGDSGWFMKAVISGNAMEEDMAILSMEVPANPRDTCLTFWYYMTGSENHALIVEIRSYGTIMEACEKTLELKTTTSSGEDWWIPAQINHNCGDAPYQVAFVAKNGGDKFSNIAVDDIFFLNGYRARDVDHRPLRTD